ncbi:MAG: hypothetical protein KBD78_13640 [Oligoflexales bacterium]|nr:hypothetical protein [Oligoflexales bacterium]
MIYLHAALTTYFEIGGNLLPIMMVSSEIKVKNVIINNSDILGIAYLLQEKGLIIGWELELITDEIEVPIKSLSIQI